MPIKVLDAATVGRIAAGEVVERPSSVVKELIENSLDAGATAVTVEIRGGGIDYLRVTDNGCGIEPGQIRLAFENHATSKLQRAEQLDDIRTLGFRGEALPSIAAVSKVEMNSRARGQDSGMKLTVEGGKDMKTVETGCPQGTTLIMRDLFYNVPVRRAFLKKASYEGGLVSDAVTRMLLGNPGVSMRFISGGSTLYHSFGDGKLRHAVFAVYGKETAEKMIEIDASEGGVRIYGLIGVGELGKATRSHQMFFINGRSVRCPLLSKALEQVCRSRVTIGMYPMCVLNLVLPPTSVDVNVHPNKLEVRFRDEENMRVASERLLATAFAGEKMLDPVKETAAGPVVNRVAHVREIPLADAQQAEPAPAPQPKPVEDSEPRKPAPVKAEQTVMDLKPVRPEPVRETRPELLREKTDAAVQGPIRTVPMPDPVREEAKRSVNEQKPLADARRTQIVEAPAQTPVRPSEPVPVPPARELPAYRIIGVAFKTYILVECGDAMLLIDQHAAHERIRYEALMARAQAGTASQQLLMPEILRVSAREMAIIEENLDTLSEAGFTVEPFGDNEIRVSSVPFVMGKAEPKPIFMEMLRSLSYLKAATVDERRAEIMQMACKSAVKGGDELSESEIRALIEEMLTTDAPPTCPHGRPVVKTMTRRDLEKLFRRIQ